ncbi:hypothetical protein WJX72_003962 [[Myrmecia] bisecta]|uniref:Uncharacterized protein n=1 Tax=[Myrmecia] bisecta TaxID=41462 RepID=A0AAW1QET9_9CHLO
MESRATTSIPHEQVLTNPHLLAEVLSRVADPVFGWDPVLWGLCAQVSKLWRAEMRLQPLDLGFETNLKLAVNTQLPIRRLRFPSPLEREHDAGDECTVLACDELPAPKRELELAQTVVRELQKRLEDAPADATGFLAIAGSRCSAATSP